MDQMGFRERAMEFSNLRITYKLRGMWAQNFMALRDYYNKKGNLDLPTNFKTENGVNLYNWFHLQKSRAKNSKMSAGEKELLDNLDKDWCVDKIVDDWDSNYQILKKYHDKYGDIKVPLGFKTKNGISYNSEGIDLYDWILRQKSRKKSLSPKQIELLDNLGMDWKKRVVMSWDDYYFLAEAYYDYYGNLDIPLDFKTKNGYDPDSEGAQLGRWFYIQKRAYGGIGNITPRKIILLERNGAVWFSKEKNDKLKSEEIDSNNLERKKKELLNRTYSLLNKFERKPFPSKKKINNEFMKVLKKQR